jgi:hypothetical protein
MRKQEWKWIEEDVGGLASQELQRESSIPSGSQIGFLGASTYKKNVPNQALSSTPTDSTASSKQQSRTYYSPIDRPLDLTYLGYKVASQCKIYTSYSHHHSYS